MERTADILPIELITSKHIKEVLDMLAELDSVKYWKEKHDRFRKLASEISEEANWLLTFSVWFSEQNTRFFSVEGSKYYTLTANSEITVQFKDFIKLIRKYNRARVTAKNEIHLVRFLQGCDREHFDFYLSLLTKTFTNSLPKSEVYDVLDMGSINLEDIYGSIEVLQTSFSDLSYPVAVTMLPDPDYKVVVQSREPRRTFSYYQTNGKLKPVKDLITLDSKYISTPRYTVIGYCDVKQIKNRKKMEMRTVVYPLDYFDTFKEYRRYVKTKTAAHTPFKERIENLKKFLHVNYLRQFIKTPIGYAENETELARQIMELYPREGSTFIVITDNNTARTGKAVAVPVTNTVGMIHSIWIEQSIPKGFEVWFNGILHKVEFDFSGANNALLNTPEMVLNKLLEFTYIRVGSLEVFIAKEIKWEQMQWKAYRYKTGAYIEKCTLCGGTEHPHKLLGLCRICEINIRKYFDNYGPEVWIPPSRRMVVKRCKSGWHYKILDVVKHAFKGHYLESREDGYWKFTYNEERYQQYLEHLKKIKRNIAE